MLKTTAAALLMSTCLVGGSVLAQTTTAPAPAAPPSTSAPATTAPATPSTTTSAAPAAGAKFVTDQGKDQFRASKFVGLDVYGADSEKIGDINEILIDAKGDAQAVVIGVGGFLGIGQKNVAVAWDSLTWSNDKPPSKSAATTTGSGTMTTGSTAPTRTTATPSTAGAPASTTASAPTRSPAEQAAYNGYPDHAMVKLTKAELQDAPAFKYVSDTSSTTGSSSNATPPAPRQ